MMQSPEVNINSEPTSKKALTSESLPPTNKYSQERQELRSKMEKKGNILPANHEFTKLIQKISEKLGVPDETEFMAIDSERPDAFFSQKSRSIVFSRGLAKYLLKREPKLSEDHIAAILAHEAEHAEVIGDDYINSIQNHAEE